MNLQLLEEVTHLRNQNLSIEKTNKGLREKLTQTYYKQIDLFFSFAKYLKENYKFCGYTKHNKETYQSEVSGKIMTEEEVFEHWVLMYNKNI